MQGALAVSWKPREVASFRDDAAKRMARLAQAKGAHDELVASVRRFQADAEKAPESNDAIDSSRGIAQNSPCSRSRQP
jgi:hypothetical protein